MADVVLEFEFGFGTRHRFWLRPGEVLRVGSSEWADYCVVHDDSLSAVHFLVEYAENCVRVQDLQSRTGTLLNGERLPEFHLRDGDVVTAGTTEFKACVSQRLSQSAKLREQVETTRPHPEQLEYRQSSLPNGLVCFASDDEATNRQAARAMTSRLQLAAVINSAALSKLTSDNLDWVRKTIPLNGQLIMLPISNPDDLEAIQDVWGRDAVTLIATDTDLERLQQQLLANPAMFSRPRIVRAQLSQGPAAYVEMLMKGIKAIMIETENGVGWNVFSQSRSEEPWVEIGFPAPLSVSPIHLQSRSANAEPNSARRCLIP